MEKQPLDDEERKLDSDISSPALPPAHSNGCRRRLRNFPTRRQFALAGFATMGGLFLLRILFGLAGSLHPSISSSSWTLGCHHHHATSSSSSSAPATEIKGSDDDSDRKLVPLEAHIMSKCPDARDCLHDLVLPTMEQIYDKVNFTLSYIGTPTYEDDGISCMHGPTECLGNILELCAASLYPDPKIYLGFTMCLSASYAQIPRRDLVSDCALEHGMSFAALNECASDEDGARGVELLRQSVERSLEAGVKKSCTVRLDGKVRCIRDGGKWYDCDGGEEVGDLVRDIEEIYDAQNS